MLFLVPELCFKFSESTFFLEQCGTKEGVRRRRCMSVPHQLSPRRDVMNETRVVFCQFEINGTTITLEASLDYRSGPPKKEPAG